MIERNILDIRSEYDWRLEVSIRLTSTFQQNNDTDDDSDQDRDYFSVEPSAIWHLAQDWDLSFSYRYRTQKRESESSRAHSNAAFLNLTYRTPEWSLD